MKMSYSQFVGVSELLKLNLLWNENVGGGEVGGGDGG